MIYGYARVSTAAQKNDGNSLEDQTAKLTEAGATAIYADAYTGARLDRPKLQELLTTLQAGDTLMATKLDRISRSVQQGVSLIDDLLQRGITVHILNMGVMNDTPTGKLIRNIMFSFAEFERDMIVERTREGKAIAKQRPGYQDGRKRIDTPEDRIRELYAKQQAGQLTASQCCKELGISRSSWYNRIREITAA